MEETFGLASGSALAAAEKQLLFFKAIDKYQVEAQGASCETASHRREDPYDAALAAAVNKLPLTYTKSTTVVIEAAFSLLSQGLLNIPDVGRINVKQARAFLWNALWLQDYMNSVWSDTHEISGRDDRTHKTLVEDFCLAIVGPGGTGKTAVLKITEALTSFFAGPETVKKLAPSNAAARLLRGDTIHALCKLPFGKAKLSSKRGRLTTTTLQTHRKRWASTIAAYLDEVSMISADQFLHCDVRMRQAKMRPERTWGGLALNICGDFLQLPPVDTDGSRRSLARPLDDSGKPVLEDEADAVEPSVDAVNAGHAEGRQGRELWTSIRRVVSLTLNVRAPDILSRLLAEMRAGSISDEMWQLYLSRVMQPQDPRLAQSPFAENDVYFVVHRHKIRVRRSLENAQEQCRRHRTPLYIVQAKDQAVRAEDQPKLTDAVQMELLR